MIDGQDDFNIFPKGERIPGGNFKGTTWLEPVSDADYAAAAE
jgi:hypothetical protein